MRLSPRTVATRDRAIEAVLDRCRWTLELPDTADLRAAVEEVIDDEGQTAARTAWTMIAAGVADPEYHSFDARLKARLEAMAVMGKEVGASVG